MGYLEGTLDGESQKEVQARLRRDKALRCEMELLRDQERELADLGQDLRHVAPGVYIADSIMRTIKEPETYADPLEGELTSLGGHIRDRIPQVALAETVKAVLEEESGIKIFTPTEVELLSVGEELRNRLPGLNLVPPVLAAVDTTASGENASVNALLRRKRMQRRNAALSWSLIAAAAGLVLCLGLLLYPMMRAVQTDKVEVSSDKQPRQTVVKKIPQRAPAVTTTKEEPAPPAKPSSESVSPISFPERPPFWKEMRPSTRKEGETPVEFTLEDLLAAKQKSLEGQADALSMLTRWGALEPDTVRRLFDEGQLTPSQLAGMSRFLPAEEAINLLQHAVDGNPENPSLRFVLAMQLMDSPTGQEEALAQMTSLKELAPENALVHYMDAKLRLSSGDYANGIAALEEAAGVNMGTAYGIVNAQYHSAALQAAGMPADLADTVAAFYAGTDEYAVVTQLRTDLLDYGATLEAEGNYEIAQTVYKSVGEMGRQVSRGAAYTNEYLAGLDTQQDALEAMNALAELVEIPGGMQTIQSAYDILKQGWELFREYTAMLENVTQVADTQSVVTAVGSILQTGDIQYLQNAGM